MKNGILLICAKPGFRRNGIAHETKKTWPAGHWSDEQIEVFDKDPMFTVLPAASVEGDVIEDTSSVEPDLASLDAGNPLRMNAIDDAITALDAADYGTEGQPNIKAMKERLGFVPMPEEVTDAVRRHDQDGQLGDWGKALRADAVKAAFEKLGEGDFTKAGSPKVSVLEKATGFKPTPEEIDAVTK